MYAIRDGDFEKCLMINHPKKVRKTALLNGIIIKAKIKSNPSGDHSSELNMSINPETTPKIKPEVKKEIIALIDSSRDKLNFWESFRLT